MSGLNRVKAFLEELEPRMLLASNLGSMAALTANPSGSTSAQTSGPVPGQATPGGNPTGTPNSSGVPLFAPVAVPSILAFNLAFNEAANTGEFASPQTSVLSVGLAMIDVPMDAGTIEGETAARSVGDYFLSNEPVGGLPPTSAMLQTVSRLTSLSQGITQPVLGGGGVEISVRNVNADGAFTPAEELTDAAWIDSYFASSAL